MKHEAYFSFITRSRYRENAVTSMSSYSVSPVTQACLTPMFEGKIYQSTLVQVNKPGGIVADKQGFVYIAESTGPWIHRISSDGSHQPQWLAKSISHTIERACYGLVEHEGFLYLSYSNAGKIVKIDLTNPAAGETVVIAGIMGVTGMAVHGNHLYATSYYHGKVIRVSLSDVNLTYRSTEHDYCIVAGARGLCFNSKGLLYVTSYGNGSVFRCDGLNNVTMVLDQLPPYITDICITVQDELYISFNATTEGVRKYEADLLHYTTPYQTGSTSASSMIWTLAMTMGGRLLAGDSQVNAVVSSTPTWIPIVSLVRTLLPDNTLLSSLSRSNPCLPCSGEVSRTSLKVQATKNIPVVPPQQQTGRPVTMVTSSPAPELSSVYVVQDQDNNQGQLLLWQ